MIDAAKMMNIANIGEYRERRQREQQHPASPERKPRGFANGGTPPAEIRFGRPLSCIRSLSRAS
jgi:hypothetical protein